MKKFLVVMLAVFVCFAGAFAFTDNGQKTAGSAAGQKVQLVTGDCALVAIDLQGLTSNATAIPTGAVIGIADAGNTYTAAAWKVTITASVGLKQFGFNAIAPNGSNRGVVIGGIKFTNGVVIDTGDAGVTSVTVSAKAIVAPSNIVLDR